MLQLSVFCLILVQWESILRIGDGGRRRGNQRGEGDAAYVGNSVGVSWSTGFMVCARLCVRMCVWRVRGVEGGKSNIFIYIYIYINIFIL